MTIGIYIRVSTDEQVRDGFSISAQREKLKAYCQVQDWEDYKFYVDEGLSAKDTNRPQLQKMIQHVQEGKITTVLVYRLDRLTRSVLDLYKLLETFDKYGCTFKSATEIYDTGSAMGRLFITLSAAMAQWERENLGERVIMGQIEKARQGEYAAKAPYGFNKDENSKLIINEEEKKVILLMISKIKQGNSIRQLATYLDENGIPPIRGYKWHIRTVLDVMQNPALYGAIKWRDEIYENCHEPILSKKDFSQLQKMLSNRRNHKKRETNSIHIFQTKLICPFCGNRLTCERARYYRKKDQQTVETNHYRCQACALNKQKPIMVSEKRMESGFKDYMRNLVIKDVSEIKEEPGLKEELTNRLSKIERQRKKFQRAWANDQMTDDEFSELMSETKKALDSIIFEMGKLEDPQKNEVDIEILKKASTLFNKNWGYLNAAEKKEFMNTFIEGIEFEKDGINAVINNVYFY